MDLSFSVIFPIWEYPFKNLFWNKIIEDNFRTLNTDDEKDESEDIKKQSHGDWSDLSSQVDRVE